MRRATFAILTLAAAVVLGMRFTPVYDPDAFWHLATGRWITVHRAIPRVDVFSHTALGRPLLFVDALADLALYAAFTLGGYGAVALLTGSLGAAATWISLRHKRFDVVLATAAPLVAGLLFRVTPRPQTFALPCFAALLACLDAARGDPRWLRAAPALIALWQNLHPSAPLGVMAVGLAAVGESSRRRGAQDARGPLAPWWISVALSLLALLVTPRPLDRLAAGLGHVSDVNMAALITEWAPLYRFDYASPYALGFYVLLGLGVAGAVGAYRAREMRIEHVALATLTAVQGVRAVRFIPFAALALAPLALRGAQTLLDLVGPRLRALVAFGFAAVVGAFAVVPQSHGWGAGIAEDHLPVGAARFLSAQPGGGRVFNEFTFGGYLIWSLGPSWPVFIDGRSMALYPPRFVDEVLRTRPEGMLPLVTRHGATVMVHRASSMLAWAQSQRGWSVVYFDDTAFVAVRDDAHPSLARDRGYRVLRPGDWSAVVSDLQRDPSRAELARSELARAQRDAPDAALPRVLEGALALAFGDHTSAERAFSRALRLRPQGVPARRGLLMSCVLRGDAPCVCARAREVLAVAPANRYAADSARRFRCP